jgi:disulfide oxidoreductase YuzD
VRIDYRNAEDEAVKRDNAKIVDEIESRGLLYPVTVVDGTPLYDGAVSYPAIMRAVQSKIADTTAEAEVVDGTSSAAEA